MDIRLFIVGLPFLVSLLITLILLINWEIKDNINPNNRLILNERTETNLSNGFLNELFINRENREITTDKLIINVIVIPTLLFLSLIFYTIHR